MRSLVLGLAMLAAPMAAWAQQAASVVATGSGDLGGYTIVTFVIVTKEGEIQYCETVLGSDARPDCTLLAN